MSTDNLWDRGMEGEPEIDRPAGDLGLVMTGGGARAAYQVGVLRAIARRFPDLRIQIITGVSAGAINAVYLGCRNTSFAESVEGLANLWKSLRIEDVFRADSPSLGKTVMKWGWRLLSGAPFKSTVRGMVDTAPLNTLLHHVLCTGNSNEISGLSENLGTGKHRAVAVTTLNYTTGQTMTWVMGRGIELWERPNRRSRHARITVDHIMASAALPLIFPGVKLDGDWHGDGGVRLAAPLSPALHLGARRILAMTTRYQKTFEEADRKQFRGYPAPMQVVGHLMNAIFLDVIDQDALRLEKLNALLKKLPVEEREGMREIDLLVLRPSVDLGRLAGDYEIELPGMLRHLLRGLGSKETSSPDFLSMLMFQADYLTRLIEIGEADGEARIEEIAALIEGRGAEPEVPPERPSSSSGAVPMAAAKP
ncbi:MAG TPA: patatin-like phospholipase family protein [Thermoanaerobaculia bacterium]|nr:patatin-like phospholipase family protein [Thermoanaerobaculia bacterium]